MGFCTSGHRNGRFDLKYYAHHIGDFDRATRHLSRIERSVYRDLIDLYYDTEQQLSLDVSSLCRRIIARTNEESTAVEQVLNEFFTKTPTGWYHDRCEEEIEAYRASNSQKSAAGKASAAKRAAKREHALNGNSTTVAATVATTVEQASNGSATNQEPVTINQEPVVPTGTKAPAMPDVQELVADGLTRETATEWLAHRKRIKAPMTPRAWTGIKNQAELAGMSVEDAVSMSLRNGWRGFEASYVRGRAQQPVNRQAALEQRNQAAMEEWLAQQGSIHEAS